MNKKYERLAKCLAAVFLVMGLVLAESLWIQENHRAEMAETSKAAPGDGPTSWFSITIKSVMSSFPWLLPRQILITRCVICAIMGIIRLHRMNCMRPWPATGPCLKIPC